MRLLKFLLDLTLALGVAICVAVTAVVVFDAVAGTKKPDTPEPVVCILTEKHRTFIESDGDLWWVGQCRVRKCDDGSYKCDEKQRHYI